MKGERELEPAVSVYLLYADKPQYQRFHCVWCSLPVVSIRGNVARLIDLPVDDSDIVVGVGQRCRRCHQRYRFVIS